MRLKVWTAIALLVPVFGVTAGEWSRAVTILPEQKLERGISNVPTKKVSVTDTTEKDLASCLIPERDVLVNFVMFGWSHYVVGNFGDFVDFNGSEEFFINNFADLFSPWEITIWAQAPFHGNNEANGSAVVLDHHKLFGRNCIVRGKDSFRTAPENVGPFILGSDFHLPFGLFDRGLRRLSGESGTLGCRDSRISCSAVQPECFPDQANATTTEKQLDYGNANHPHGPPCHVLLGGKIALSAALFVIGLLAIPYGFNRSSEAADRFMDGRKVSGVYALYWYCVSFLGASLSAVVVTYWLSVSRAC